MFKNKASAMKSVSNLMSNLHVQAKDLQTKASAKYTGYVQPSHVTHEMITVNGAPLSPEALDILKGQKNGLRVSFVPRATEGALKTCYVTNLPPQVPQICLAAVQLCLPAC